MDMKHKLFFNTGKEMVELNADESARSLNDRGDPVLRQISDMFSEALCDRFVKYGMQRVDNTLRIEGVTADNVLYIFGFNLDDESILRLKGQGDLHANINMVIDEAIRNCDMKAEKEQAELQKAIQGRVFLPGGGLSDGFYIAKLDDFTTG